MSAAYFIAAVESSSTAPHAPHVQISIFPPISPNGLGSGFTSVRRIFRRGR